MDGEEREELEQRWLFEKNIRKAVDDFNQGNPMVGADRILTFGYIGNYGSITWNSGVDDRKLIIWYGAGGEDEPRPTLWEHEARDLDAVSYGKAIASIRSFARGFDAGSSYQQNHWESMAPGTRIVCKNKVFCYIDEY